MRVNDAVFGGALVLGALALVVHAQTFPDMPGQRFGPALFPTLIGIGFGLCGLSLLWAGLVRREVPGVILVPEWMRSQGEILDVLLVLGGLVVLILVWDHTGFLIGATLYSGLLISRFRHGRVASSLAMAFVACLVIDFAFRRWLLVPLPLGPLTGIVW
ncbi:MAG TPA: tripartite tricarboxylate transporter TctB family protein [Geminicoccaceae bacterium]|nr:tripartite tricarboxylate transporter TctB family protein [Geminicoccaceae bacterium]